MKCRCDGRHGFYTLGFSIEDDFLGIERCPMCGGTEHDRSPPRKRKALNPGDVVGYICRLGKEPVPVIMGEDGKPYIKKCT